MYLSSPELALPATIPAAQAWSALVDALRPLRQLVHLLEKPMETTHFLDMILALQMVSAAS